MFVPISKDTRKKIVIKVFGATKSRFKFDQESLVIIVG